MPSSSSSVRKEGISSTLAPAPASAFAAAAAAARDFRVRRGSPTFMSGRKPMLQVLQIQASSMSFEKSISSKGRLMKSRASGFESRFISAALAATSRVIGPVTRPM